MAHTPDDTEGIFIYIAFVRRATAKNGLKSHPFSDGPRIWPHKRTAARNGAGRSSQDPAKRRVRSRFLDDTEKCSRSLAKALNEGENPKEPTLIDRPERVQEEEE